MQKNFKKREFLEADRPLAINCLMGARTDPKSKSLIEPYAAWVKDIDEQLATFPQAQAAE